MDLSDLGTCHIPSLVVAARLDVSNFPDSRNTDRLTCIDVICMTSRSLPCSTSQSYSVGIGNPSAGPLSVSQGILLLPNPGSKYKNPDVAVLPRACLLSTMEKKTSSHDGAGWPSASNLRRATYIRRKKPRTTTKKAVAMNARPEESRKDGEYRIRGLV